MIRLAIRQPVTVTVGVLLVLLAGFLALQRLPIQLTPNVEDTVVAVQTRWDGASPQEVEQEIVDPQEERLQGIPGLKRMTSESSQGQGQVRLEFTVGTPKEHALREVSDKLREVPRYPQDADEPIIHASDPQSRDYIAWLVFETTDPELDIRTLQDFAEDRIKPVLERVPGVSEVNVLGGREREVQVRYDTARLAQHGITIPDLAAALRGANLNRSAGALAEAKSDVRVRMTNRYSSVAQVEETVVTDTPSGPVRVRDVAEVVETYEEPRSFVRSRGRPVIAINAQREVGANVMQVMEGLRAGVARLNAPGGLLEVQARAMELDGGLRLTQVYDQTVYIDDALALVRNNIWIGGTLAITVLLLFLRAVRPAAIIALAIPISVIGAVVAMVVMGRSVNVISLAGMAFAIGMVVDNAIVVLENVYRHVELGKRPAQAALDGAKEVWGAVLASTLTTIVVFVPILLVEEEAGQLFRDIALAIVAAVALSLVVSITVIPSSASRLLRPVVRRAPARDRRSRLVRAAGRPFARIPDLVAGTVHALSGSVLARVTVVGLLTAASVVGTYLLLPPADYLPQGNRNLVFGMAFPPPGYSLDQKYELAHRIEETIRPFFEAGFHERGSEEYERARAALPEVPSFDRSTMSPGEPVQPPPLDNYFLVSSGETMFHGGVATEPDRVADLEPLFAHATRPDVAPGVMAFGQQVPLFRLGGRSGSALEVDFVGEDLSQVTRAAQAIFFELMGRWPGQVQPDPSNFDLPSPEVQVVPDPRRLAEVGLTPEALGLAVASFGDGAYVGEYLIGSHTVDLELVAIRSLERGALAAMADQPIATPAGGVVPLGSVADVRRVNAAPQINRTGRQRSVSLQVTPPEGASLQEVMEEVAAVIAAGRESGTIPPSVETTLAGSASKLDAVQRAMLGDRTVGGTITSSLFLALLVVYFVMCVLFQSFLRPLIIMFSVPLATLGGFAALAGVHAWSVSDRHMPVQNLDVLTMLGFVILIGIVVNNSILIVHQSINFMRGADHTDAAGRDTSEPLPPRDAIAQAVRSRVRPIFMSTMTSVLGMAPLVFMPGAGSELYRGLGSVVIGGLLVSTVFTLFLVPLLLSLVSDAQDRLGLLPEKRERPAEGSAAPRAAARAGAALAVLLASTLVLAGCAASARTGPPASRLADEVKRSEVARIEAEGAEPVTLAAPPSPVEEPIRETLAERMEELAALGGPAAWASADPDFRDDLRGRPPVTRPIDLREAVGTALEHNLGLRIASVGPRIAEQDVVIAGADFDVVVFANATYEDAEEPQRVPVIGGVTVGAPERATERELLELGVRKLLQSGATVSVSTLLERIENKTSGIAFEPDPAWRSDVIVSVTQPLLEGYGRDVTLADLVLARSREEATEEERLARLLEVAALAEQSYWDLAEAWQRLHVQQRLLDQGLDVERVLRERLAFDVGQPEYADAVATVELRRSDVLRAERLVEAASDALKALMSSPELPVSSEVLLLPFGEMDVAPISFQLDAAVLRALERRPEVRAALLAIQDEEVRERVAVDSLRPRLDLVAQAAAIGLDDSAGSSFDSLASDDDYVFLLGLAFEHPIGNRAARASVERARLAGKEALLRYEEQVQDVVVEVKGALRDLRTNFALVAATRSQRVAQAENLRAILVEEEGRRQLTPEFLALKFQRQERLAQAQLQEVEAIAGYNRALAAYHRAIGTGLRAESVVVE